MIHLSNFIFQEHLRYNFNNYIDDNNIDIENLPINECLKKQYEFLNTYKNYNDYQFWLYETLGTSIDYKIVISKVKSVFGDDIEIYPENVSSKIKMLRCFGNKEIFLSKKFVSLMNMFNYEIINIHDNFCHLKQRKSTDITDKIYNDFNGVVYHLTTKQKYESIKRKGIIPKDKNSDVNRTYVLSSNNIEKINSDVFSLMLHNVRSMQSGTKMVLLTIKLPKERKIKFYEDDGAKGYNAFWTMEYIPSDWIINVENKKFGNIKIC